MRIRALLSIVVTAAALLAGVALAVDASASPSTSTLTAGQSLGVGGQIASDNGDYHLIVQADGNLVNYGPYGPVWSTGTSGADAKLVMQTDGNLVLYVGGRAVFQTSTFVTSDRLVLQSDGNLVLYSAADYPLWFTGIPPLNTLRTGWVLGAGSRLVAPGGAYSANMQTDGNFVVYGPSGALFQTGTRGSGAQLVMQADGNLVLYVGGRALFQTGTRGSGAQLVMQPDGNLVVYVGSHALWATGTVLVRTRLVAGDMLDAGGSLVSPSGRYRAAVQADGVVVYGPSGAIWVGQRPDPDQRLSAIGLDGHAYLTQYFAPTSAHPSGTGVIWFPNADYGAGPSADDVPTTADGTASMVMQDDGNLVLYGFGQALWSSQTGLISLTPLPEPTLTGSGAATSVTLHLAALSADLKAKFTINGSAGVTSADATGPLKTLTTLDGTTNTWTQTGLADHTAYLYQAVTTDRYGRRKIGGYFHVNTSGAGTTVIAGTDTVATGASAALGPVSCASPSLCVALTRPGTGSGALNSGTGPAYLYNGSNWSTISTSLTPGQVSCVAGPLCVLSDGTQFSVYTGSGWSTPATFGDSAGVVTQVSCGSPSFCLATDNAGKSLVFNGTSWAISTSPAAQFLALSCSSATFCEGITAASSYSFDGHVWTNTGHATNGGFVGSLSCRPGGTTTADCVALAPDYIVGSVTGSTSGWVQLYDSQSDHRWAVSCAAQCVSVSADASSVLTSLGTWSLSSPLSNAGSFTGLSCPTASFCVAVTDQGQAVRFHP